VYILFRLDFSLSLVHYLISTFISTDYRLALEWSRSPEAVGAIRFRDFWDSVRAS